MLNMFPEVAVETESVPIAVSLFVNVPLDKVNDKLALTRAAIEWLAQLTDTNDAEYEPPEVFANRVFTPLEFVENWYLGRQKSLPSLVSYEVKRLVEALDPADRPDIHLLRFETEDVENGVFFVAQPDLVLRGKLLSESVPWENVLGMVDIDNSKLEYLVPDMTEAFGPLSIDTELVIDMDTGEVVWP